MAPWLVVASGFLRRLDDTLRGRPRSTEASCRGVSRARQRRANGGLAPVKRLRVSEESLEDLAGTRTDPFMDGNEGSRTKNVEKDR